MLDSVNAFPKLTVYITIWLAVDSEVESFDVNRCGRRSVRRIYRQELCPVMSGLQRRKQVIL
jgi:hypothetical protein